MNLLLKIYFIEDDNMRKKLKRKYLKIEEIKEEIRLIPGSDIYYAGSNGNIYIYHSRTNSYFKKKLKANYTGYVYTSIKINNKTKTFRVHRLIASIFIDNPNNLPIVGHLNNIKNDNRVDNLYWTSISENTKKAFDDGLAKNDKGYDDSQSFPVYVFDLNNKLLYNFGSTSECAKNLKISKSTVLRQCHHITKGKPRGKFYFRFQDEYNNNGFVL